MDQNNNTDQHRQDTVPQDVTAQRTSNPVPPSITNGGAAPAQSHFSPRAIAIRMLLVKLLLAAVIAAAVVAVVAILMGSMSDIAWRAIWTLVSAMIHIGILFAVVSTAASNDPRTERSTNFVINLGITIAVMSFFTSLLGIWEILPFDVYGRLYATYAIILFATLHAKTMLDMTVDNVSLKPYVYANFGVIATVVALLLGYVYAPDEWEILNGFYGRLLAATVIIDVTLGVVVAVLQRMFLQKHPELLAKQAGGSGASGVSRLIVAILLFVFVVWPIFSIIRFLAP